MLILILLLGLVLRLIAINQSFWLDETVQVWASSNFSLKDLFNQYMPGDFNPPLYHLLTHYWIKIFGVSELRVRLLSVILGLFSILLIWKIAELIDNKKLAIISSLLLATSPLHIYYSQENRMYMLACFAVLLAVWRFLIYLKQSTIKNSLLLGISFLIMGFSHFLTLFTLPVFLFFGLKKAKSKNLLISFAIPILGYLIYSPLLIKQLQMGLSWTKQFPVWGKTVGSFSLKAAALLPVKFIIGRINIANKLTYGLISIFLVVVYWGLSFYGLIKKDKIREKSLVYSLLIIPPLLGFIISFKVPVFSYFRFLFVLPFFYLTIAMVLKDKNNFLIITLLGINIIFSGTYLLRPKFHREDWKGLTQWLQQENSNKSPVIILSQISKPFEHYSHGKKGLVIIGNPQDFSLSKNNNQIFLISYSLPIFDPEDKIREELRKSGYKVKKLEDFRKVGVEYWNRN